MNEILIIEDDVSINELIKMTLMNEGCSCMQAFCGVEAMNMTDMHRYDLVLLDVNLPDIDGFSLYGRLGNSPVIFITARDEISDKIRGFDCGAEDYIVKPFDLQELVKRVNVVLRRNLHKNEEKICIGMTTVDFRRAEAETNGKTVGLNRQELQLLKALVDHKEMTLTRRQLLDLAWDDDYCGDVRTVDVHIRRLRDKLDLGEHIVTVYKVGYRLEM